MADVNWPVHLLVGGPGDRPAAGPDPGVDGRMIFAGIAWAGRDRPGGHKPLAPAGCGGPDYNPLTGVVSCGCGEPLYQADFPVVTFGGLL